MHYELLMGFEAIRPLCRTGGYPENRELRGAHRAQRGRHGLFAALRALTAHVSQEGEKR